MTMGEGNSSHGIVRDPNVLHSGPMYVHLTVTSLLVNQDCKGEAPS